MIWEELRRVFFFFFPYWQEESSNLELNALRSIIKCVESLKLEQEFALESPRKRVQMLEKAKAERKKVAAVKPYNKRARVAGQPTFFRPTKATRTPTSPYPSSRRQPPMDHYVPPPRHAFMSPSHGAYKVPGSSPYGGTYNRSPPSSQQPYYVPEEVAGPGSSMAYGAPPPASYSGYEFSGGPSAGPAQPAYPSQM